MSPCFRRIPEYSTWTCIYCTGILRKVGLGTLVITIKMDACGFSSDVCGQLITHVYTSSVVHEHFIRQHFCTGHVCACGN